MHLDSLSPKLVSVIQGQVFDLCVDMRENSPRKGQAYMGVLSGEDHQTLVIPPGFLHGYQVLEPLRTLRKDGVRAVAAALGMPDSMVRRIPFPGPALATRIVGEVTGERLATVRAATEIVEQELAGSGAFQYLAVLLSDRATGIRDGKREFGQIVVVRCIDSTDARQATATRIDHDTLARLCTRITALPDVTRCLYDLTPKPPATVEYI